MRLIAWTDRDGWKRTSFIKDDQDDDMAPQGIPQSVVPINELDWDAIKRDLHNALINRSLFGYEDIIKQRDSVNGAILSAVRGRLITLYKDRRAR